MNRLTKKISAKARAQQSTPRSKRQNAQRGGGAGQRETIRGSGIYPASGPMPRGRATIRTQAELGHTTGRTTGSAKKAARPSGTRRPYKPVPRQKALIKRTQAAGSPGAQPAQEIPRNQWSRFLDRFSREHDGWLTRVDVSKPGTRGGTEARLMPLLGISIDMKPSAKDTTSIMLDVRPNVHLTHWVPRTKQVIFDEQKQRLQITSSTGDRAIVCLEKPARR